MSISLGKVERYIEDKGFGFITPCFMNDLDLNSIFFHIKTVSTPDVVKSLESEGYLKEPCFVWYTYTKTPKGYAVTSVLDIKDVRDKASQKNKRWEEHLRTVWGSLKSVKPEWLELATQGVMGQEAVHTLKAALAMKEEEANRLRVIEEQNKLLKAETVSVDAYNELLDELTLLKEQVKNVQQERDAIKSTWESALSDQAFYELELLVREVKQQRFTQSHEISKYIVKNRLGDKYRHLSGVLEMENDERSWGFDGGVSPKYYAQLCEKLELDNKNTRSWVSKFTPYKDL